MGIDWFTAAAQAVNFFILVWLLKKFLYGPITRAMDKREASIRDRLESARREKEQAEEEAETYRRKNATFEEKRAEMTKKAEEDAAELRKNLEKKAREEADKTRREWQEELKKERQAIQEDARRYSAEQFVSLARRILKDLADSNLEAQIVSVFLTRLSALEDSERSALASSIQKAGGALILSAFDLDAAQKRQVTSAVQEAFGKDVELTYRTTQDLSCGLRLDAAGRSLVWSVDSFVDSFAEKLDEDLAEMTAVA